MQVIDMRRRLPFRSLTSLLRFGSAWFAPEELDMQTVDREHWLPFQFLASLLRFRSGWFANHARGCMKSVGAEIGNDPILAAAHIDEMSRRILGGPKMSSRTASRYSTQHHARVCNPCIPLGLNASDQTFGVSRATAVSFDKRPVAARRNALARAVTFSRGISPRRQI